MSVRAAEAWPIRRMQVDDIPAVIAIESRAYSHPWSERIFRDCLRVGYYAWVIEAPGDGIVAYTLATIAVGEAHLLNICVAPEQRGQRLAEQLLATVIAQARHDRADTLYLEVRPSNKAARKLYTRYGFARQGVRPDYYPGETEREDALLLSLPIEP